MKRMLLIWVALLMTSCGNAMASVPKRDQRQVPNQENNATEGELWAVLVAGSSGWFNYRHQADICHAYQILRKHGVPDDHIIVMMYDDIAYNEENPDPGVIINRPDGPNVYEGILKDYIGEDVTPQNFLNVLKGNSSAMAGIGSGKVVKSSKNDRIFINLVDHGAPGIFAFPGSYLHARTLVNTVLKLHQQRKFEQMVIYVEACESGSMFSNLLPDDVQIYALSASNPHEPSYACYMDENLQTYLGDVFSVKWMEDTDRENIHHETLRHQFKLVRREVTTSTVMEWGEFDVNKQKLDEFMGEKNHSYLNSVLHPSDDPENHQELSKVLKFDAEIEKKTDDFMGKKDHRYRNSIRYPNDNLENHQVLPEVLESDAEIKKKMRDDDCLNSAYASPDVPIAIIKSRMELATSEDDKARWNYELRVLHLLRLLVHVVMRSLVKEITRNDDVATKVIKGDLHNITRWECYEQSVDTFHDKCFNLAENPYALRVLQMFVNLCEHGYTAESFMEAAENTCNFGKYTGIN